MWKKFFPASEWLTGYSLKIFGSDAVAGITLAAYAIPVSLAYAMLAGLPPQYGVYGYLLGGLFYAILGTGRQLSVGPTSAISLLIGTTIAGMANGDPQRWADIAAVSNGCERRSARKNAASRHSGGYRPLRKRTSAAGSGRTHQPQYVAHSGDSATAPRHDCG